MTRCHIHTETFRASAALVFSALVTPSAIRTWWSAERVIVVPERGGVFAATWGGSEDEPDFTTVARIAAYEPPQRLVLDDYRYRARTGALPFVAEFVTTFTVAAAASGASLTVAQDGFPSGPEADEFFAGCEVGWRNTFAGLRRFLESSDVTA